MAEEVFGRTTGGLNGVFDGEKVRVLFGSVAGGDDLSSVGMLTQQLQVSYQLQVTRFYELNSDKHYYVIGRTAGQGSMNRIIGPKGIADDFYRQYGKACNASKNNLFFNLGAYQCDSSGQTGQATTSGNYELSYVILNQIALGANVGDMVVNEQIGLMFTNLSR